MYVSFFTARLLYQEYSDVVLNKAIQSQKRVDYPEDIESSFPSSPRLRRKVLSPQDSYLQRLSVSSNASLWQDIPMIRGSRMLLNMSREEQRLQEVKDRCDTVHGWSVVKKECLEERLKQRAKTDVGRQVVEAEVTSTPGSSMGCEVEQC